MMNLPDKIVSGGQTGVDQGALDFALMHGMDCGGWCPKGRECETGRIPDKYPLLEISSDDYNERTRRNILTADATLVITARGRMEEGTRLTLSWAGEYQKPYYHLDLDEMQVPDKPLMQDLKKWLAEHPVNTLNVAGNRESTSPGICKITVKILEDLYGITGQDLQGWDYLRRM